MQLALRNGISFCQVGGRTVFLDIVADRYFCLSAVAECSFLRLVENGGSATHEDACLSNLISRDMLVRSSAAFAPRPCGPPPLPEASLLDRSMPRAGMTGAASALCSLGAARARLRVTGLAPTLSRLAARKALLPCGSGAVEPLLERMMAGFVRASCIATLLDNCLAHSIAVASRMVAGGIRPDVILGVQLGPFAAHCWVQHEDRIINDRFDMVRTFTPILAI
ncbi:MAG TPA: lasso peptide biosynthesis B2 protein [Sphingomonas sp.]|nr:lasso peptide biosynthesis B2 protein [Sphingomonas sp.]